MLAFICLKKNKGKQCMEYAKKCLSISPKNIYAKFLVAQCKLKQKFKEDLCK